MSRHANRLMRVRSPFQPLVLAHYFTPFPISLDNMEASSDYYQLGYLDPRGEGDKHIAYGGYLRDRPIPRSVSNSPSWQLDDLKTDIIRAHDAGIDGFMVDLIGVTDGFYLWERTKLLLRAAFEVPFQFSICLMPDGTAGATESAATLSQALRSLVNGPHSNALMRLADGRLVISPFCPENRGAAFWRDQFLPQMKGSGVAVAFVPCFVDYFANVDSFAPFSYGMSFWGDRSTAALQGIRDRAADAHTKGKLWMSPVALQDARPALGTYQEASNTETLCGMWNAAIDTKAEWVQIITWNDYAENTHIAPSAHTGWGPLELCRYYISILKYGSPPAMQSLYVSHRIQMYDTLPTYIATLPADKRPASPLYMKPSEYATSPRNTVEALTILDTPTTVKLRIGGSAYEFAAPSGMSARTFPLEIGTITATLGAKSVNLPYSVVSAPYVQDLDYYMTVVK